MGDKSWLGVQIVTPKFNNKNAMIKVQKLKKKIHIHEHMITKLQYGRNQENNEDRDRNTTVAWWLDSMRRLGFIGESIKGAATSVKA